MASSAGVDVQRGVGAIVHVVPAVEFPIVVLQTATVHAVANVAGDADGAFILPGLVNDPRAEGNELREVAAVQDKLVDLLAADGGTQFGGTGLDLSDTFTSHHDFFGDGPDGESHVDAIFLADVQNNLGSRELLKAFCGNAEVVSIAGQPGTT